MEPKIVTRKQFNIIGFEMKTKAREDLNHPEISAFWEKIMKEELLEKIPNKVDQNQYGICADMNSADNTFVYIIGHEVSSMDNVPGGMIARTIPEAEYALFTVKGVFPKSIQDAFKFIYKEWFPKSGYKHTGAPEFEYYDHRCCQEIPEMDIYIPVVKAK
jgi:AraC family transcriptional regulator